MLIALAEHGERDPSPVLYSRVVKKLKEIINDLKHRHPSMLNQSFFSLINDILLSRFEYYVCY